MVKRGAEDATRDLRVPSAPPGTVSDTGDVQSVDPAFARTIAVSSEGEPSTANLVGQMIDRYRVLARLGAGGMGVVYAALDPALDRKVALKLLPSLADERRAHLETRLRREAQALAKLDHPNVVRVYDVGIAEHSVFVAMQLVDGPTLAEYIEQRKPRPREILALFAAAGRGLAAAHDAGIIHRDVKPSNILVDTHGNVYVGDFGLARGREDGEDAVAHGNLLDAQLTRAGVVVGTPVYMSPEQHRGEPATARSDQYSFCVSLWVELFGTHPFCSGPWTPAAIAAMRSDSVREPPGGKGVATRVVKALRRGLRHDPEARWPSMLQLVDEIAPRSRAQYVWAAAAIGGMAAAVALTAWWTATPSRAAACSEAASRVDGVWNSREHDVAEAFAKAGLDREGKVIAQLALYAGDWKKLRTEACTAEASSQALRDQQAHCLDDDLRVFGDLAEALRTAPRPVLARAYEAVMTLPKLADCSAAAVAAVPPVPASALVGVAEAHMAMARAHTALLDGKYLEARGILEHATAEAQPLKYPPVLAELAFAQAELAYKNSDTDAGTLASRAAELAAGAHLDRLAAMAYALALTSAANANDTAKILTLMSVARAAAQRVGEPVTIAQFDHAAANAEQVAGHSDAALALCKDALEQAAALPLGPDGERDRVDVDEEADACFSEIYLARVDIPKAGEWADRWYQHRVRRHGDGLGTLEPLRALAGIRVHEGKYEEALVRAKRIVALTEGALGADSPELVDDLGLLAQLQHQVGETDKAIETAQRAAAIVDTLARRPNADPHLAMMSAITLAQLYRSMGQQRAMMIHYAEALVIGERTLPANDPHLANVRMIIGVTYVDGGQLDRGDALLAKAAASFRTLGDPRADLADAQRAYVLEARGNCDAAAPLLEGAVDGMQRSGLDRAQLLRARLHLAYCVWGRDRERAHALVDGVVREAQALGSRGTDIAGDASAWLATHRIGEIPQPTPGIRWATSVRGVSSEYANVSWAAAQALGAPDVYPASGDARNAWASAAEDAETEFLELGFPAGTRANAIVIYETYHPGAVASVDITLASGARRNVYRNAAPVHAREASRIQTIDFPCTAEPIAAVRITLASKAVAGWNEIDAVGAVVCP